jgi:hypothetical protein
MERRRCPITMLIHQFKVRTCCTATHTHAHTHSRCASQHCKKLSFPGNWSLCVVRLCSCTIDTRTSPLDTTSRSQSCSSFCVVCRYDMPRAGWWRVGLLLAHFDGVLQRGEENSHIRLTKKGNDNQLVEV